MDTKSKTHEANPQKGFVVQINASENFGLVVLVGQRKALAIAVRNHGSRRRWAKLREHLTGNQ